VGTLKARLAKLKKKRDSLLKITFDGYPDKADRLAWKASKIEALAEEITVILSVERLIVEGS